MVEKERRASQRFKAKPGDNVYYIEGAGAIRDLSLEGVFVLDAEPLPVGTNISFSIRLGSETVTLSGIVQQCVEQQGMGIQFKEMSKEARRRLRLHIATLS
jgi:hypothetical protein